MSLASLEAGLMFHSDLESELSEERANFESLWAQIDMGLLDENVAMAALHQMWGYAKKSEKLAADPDPAVAILEPWREGFAVAIAHNTSEV